MTGDIRCPEKNRLPGLPSISSYLVVSKIYQKKLNEEGEIYCAFFWLVEVKGKNGLAFQF